MGIGDSSLAELVGKFKEAIPVSTSLGHRVRVSGHDRTGCSGAHYEVSAEELGTTLLFMEFASSLTGLWE